MSGIRAEVELLFEAFSRWLYHNPLKSLMVMALVVAALVSQLPHIELDTSTEGFMHEDDPALVEYNRFRDQFGRDEMLIVAVKVPDVFDLGTLRKLKALHEDLKQSVPHLADIRSLVNARDMRGQGDQLIVDDLLDELPATEAELLALRACVDSNPLFKNLLISQDNRFTTIVIKTNTYSAESEGADTGLDSESDFGGFDDDDFGVEPTGSAEEKPAYLTDRENSEVVSAVRKVVAGYDAPDFDIHLAGSNVVTDTLKRMMLHDMRKFMALALAAIVVFLFVMFRRVSGVAIPLIVVVLSLLSTVGLMAAFGVHIKLPTQILPSFLLAVSVGDSVHVLAIFYRRYMRTGDKEDAVVFAMGHSGLAIALTSLTTAAGLLSFATADIAPIADLGVFASAGVMLALLYTVVLVPVFLALMPVKKSALLDSGLSEGRLDRILCALGDFATLKPWRVLAISFTIIAISATGMTRIVFGHFPLHWFPADSEVRQSTELIDRQLKGSVAMEVVLDTGRENGLYEPAVMDALDGIKRRLESYDDGTVFVGKAQGVADVLKEINRALNEDQEEYYTIPRTRALIAQELLLFENSGSDDLEDLVDSGFSKARFTLKVPFVDAVKYDRFLSSVDGEFEDAFGKGARYTLTGMITLFAQTISNVITTMAESYLIAFAVISVMMIMLLGSLRLGLLSMIPNLSPIVIAIGIMGWMGWPMDLFVMMVGSIALGLAVDDTVHFMHNFRRYYEQTGDVRKSVHETLLGTGRAMLITTCVLSIGFFIFALADMENIFRFGVITGLAIVLALLADFFMAPALLAIVMKRGGFVLSKASSGGNDNERNQ